MNPITRSRAEEIIKENGFIITPVSKIKEKDVLTAISCTGYKIPINNVVAIYAFGNLLSKFKTAYIFTKKSVYHIYKGKLEFKFSLEDIVDVNGKSVMFKDGKSRSLTTDNACFVWLMVKEKYPEVYEAAEEKHRIAAAEEAKRRAVEEEARRKAEEQRQAEEAQRKAAEEEAKRRAEEERQERKFAELAQRGEQERAEMKALGVPEDLLPEKYVRPWSSEEERKEQFRISYENNQLFKELTQYGQLSPESFQKLQSMADAGNAGACDTLALIYEYGKGVPQDRKTAEKYYRMAAEGGDDSAQEYIGRMLLLGVDYPKDVEAGVRYLKMAVRKQNEDAMFFYGKLLEVGWEGEIPMDPRLAAYFMEKGKNSNMANNW